MNVSKDHVADIKRIAEQILTLAERRQKESSNLVAAIHAAWIEVGLELGKKMQRIIKAKGDKNGS